MTAVHATTVTRDASAAPLQIARSQGTDTVQSLIVGRAITGLSAFA